MCSQEWEEEKVRESNVNRLTLSLDYRWNERRMVEKQGWANKNKKKNELMLIHNIYGAYNVPAPNSTKADSGCGVRGGEVVGH